MKNHEQLVHSSHLLSIAERAQINTAEEEETKVLSLKRAAVELKPHLTFYYQNLKRAAEWALRLNWSRHYRGAHSQIGMEWIIAIHKY